MALSFKPAAEVEPVLDEDYPVRNATMDCVGCEIPVSTFADDDAPMCQECLDAAFAGY